MNPLRLAFLAALALLASGCGASAVAAVEGRKFGPAPGYSRADDGDTDSGDPEGGDDQDGDGDDDQDGDGDDDQDGDDQDGDDQDGDDQDGDDQDGDQDDEDDGDDDQDGDDDDDDEDDDDADCDGFELTCQQPPPDPSLRARWMMDEISGSAIADSSGNGRDGTAIGTTIASGKAGNARRGTLSGESITVPSGTLPATDFTVLMWIKIFDSSNEHKLYFHGPTSGCNPSSSWFMASGGVPATLLHGVGCADASTIVSPGTLDLNNWHLVGFATDASKRTTLYIDGVAQNTPTDNTAGNSLGEENDTIGGYWAGGSFFQGMGYTVDDVRIYGRVLDASEILGLYDSTP